MRELFNWQRPKLFDPCNPLCVWLSFFNVTLISMLAIVDLLSSVVVTTQMQGFLAIDDTKTQWIGKAFFFFAALAPLYSIHAANNYGYKRMLFLGNVIFSIGAIGTGFATNYMEMLIFRAMGGMGGGIVMTISLNIINTTVQERQLAIAVTAYNNLFFGFGIALGLLLGGYIGQSGEWRGLFLMNLYLSLPTLLLTWILLPETKTIKTKRFDYLGFALVTLFFFALLLIVTQVKAPWNTLGVHSPFIHLCLSVVFISSLLFFYHMMRATHPVIDFCLFKNIRFCMGCIGLIIVGFMIFGATIAMMELLENVFFWERWFIGKFVSMVGFTYLVCGLITSILAKKVHPRYFVLTGLLLIIASCFLHQNITIQSGPFQIGEVLLLRSIGIGLVLGPITVLALAPFKREEAHHAVAFLTFSRQMAATFGSSLITMIIQLRTPFHFARFGEQVNIYSPGYEQYFQELKQFLSEKDAEGAPLATQLIIQWIKNQAILASLNDALYLLGYATIAITVAIAILALWRRKYLDAIST